MTFADYVQLAFETGLILVVLAIVFALVWGTTHEEHPDCPCRLCGRVFSGPSAPEMADDCEADHFRKGDSL